MPNRLAGETSPYLLQHAHNPVDWYPWGPEALARARAEDKPIFLSIGYAACHWCHVMERESFENEATAARLNADFVAIKVDREERPDLDQVYMSAVQAMTGGGGWPMSVFLTPDGRPFYGGTYFPDEPRQGMPSFGQVLEGVQRAWREQRSEVEESGARLVEALAGQARLAAGGLPDRTMLEAAVAALEREFDAANGGWGRAPKFPQPMTIEFLLRRAASGDGRALAMARRSLDRMADGGIHDQLGGGFHRYATDAIWLVPHFEKMLYDNGQLARVYLHAYQATGEPRYLEVALRTLDYVEREMRTGDGAWAASQDADTDGVEGATFVWTQAELEAVLAGAEATRTVETAPGAPPPLAEVFATAYGVTERGNWEGKTILARTKSDEEVAAAHGLSSEEVRRRLARARDVLVEARAQRPQPARDDKVLAAWNGLMLAAFADAVAVLEAEVGQAVAAGRDPDPALADRAAAFRAAATRAADVLLTRLRGPDGRLGRSWKDGRLTGRGVLEDHAHLAEGLLALYEATFDERWFRAAMDLVDDVLARFADPDGGFFDTADDHEALVTRPKDVQDNAVPSGNATAVTVLLRLAGLTGQGRYSASAERAIGLVAPFAARYPTGFAQWLIAIDEWLAAGLEIAIVGSPDDPATTRLLAPARRGFRPYQVIAVAPEPAASAVPLLQGRFALNGRPTAFVCRNFACRQPVHEPEALAALLADGD